jgi:lipid-A-disaccharide synthase
LNLFVGCGEASGDRYAARIASALRTAGYGGELWGRVGPKGEAAGIEPVFPCEELAILGIMEALYALPQLLGSLDLTVRAVLERRPDAVVLIDAPDFHLPLARRLRARGYRGPIVDVAPPTVWAWRRGRLSTLSRVFSLCLPLFEFEHRFLREHGVPSAWRGHPLLDDRGCGDEAPVGDSRRIALLPGSRASELRRLLPVLEGTADRLAGAGFEPVFSVAPGLEGELRNRLRDRLGLAGRRFDEGEGAELMARSACVVGASGTATLEALLARRYMVILFRTGLLNWIIARVLIRTPFIGIPNLVAGESLFPELIQGRATASAASGEVLAYLEDPDRRNDLDRRMRDARGLLGEPRVYPFWAEKILGISG